MSSPASSSARAASTEYYDAHNHLQDEALTSHLVGILQQLEALPVKGVVVNGTGEQDWPEVSRLAAQHSWILPSFGLHPWRAGGRSPDWRGTLEQLLQQHPTAGVGEIGLDRWMLEEARRDDPRLAGLPRASLSEQRDVFTVQLQIAANCNRAATIHCLNAWELMAEVLENAPVPARGFLLHAYGGPAELVSRLVERGAYFSFNGSFLSDRKEHQQQVFRSIPLERLLVETDAPAMPLPLAWRTHKLPPGPSGTIPNHPGNIEATYGGLAAVRCIGLGDLSAAVTANFRRLFGPP